MVVYRLFLFWVSKCEKLVWAFANGTKESDIDVMTKHDYRVFVEVDVCTGMRVMVTWEIRYRLTVHGTNAKKHMV